MKSKLLLILLLVSSFTFAQTWNQVGATQFTNFADTAEITFNAAGQPYMVYHNPTNDEIVVETFDGTNWVAVGTVISTQGHNNLAININPVTQEPWVALKRNGSGNGSTVDVFRYDGTSWIQEGTNILFISGLYTYGIQLQFDGSGNPRIAGVNGGGGARQAVFATYVSTNSWTIELGRTEPNLRLDFTDYDNYFYSEHYGRFSSFQGYIRKHTVLNNSNADAFALGYYPSRTLEVSGISGTNYFVSNDIIAYDATTNPTPYPDIIFGNGDTSTGQPQPLNTTNNTNNILKFRESTSDNNLYLMFSDSNENLVFQKYNVGGQLWSVLPSIGLSTSSSTFFTSMEMNPVNGDMYVTYLDGGKVSVKRFSIETPLPKYYVNTNVTGGDGSGDSWVNAMPNLSDALNIAGSITTDVWVAAGTYKPSSSSRSASFNISVDNLQVIGGFDGTETAITQRDIASNPTILSGDLNGDDAGVDFATVTRSDNSYHVVKINANDIVLDGFIIQDGHANGGTGNNEGSAINKAETANALNLKNCTIKNNVSLVAGTIRSWFDINGTMNIENSIFDGNVSTYASGIYAGTRDNRTLTANITNSLFTNNVSKNNGGTLGYTGSSAWIRANGSGSTVTSNIVNSTFANNIDTGTQAALVNKGTLSLARTSGTHNATISNTIFYNNENASGVTSLAVTQGHVTAASIVVVNNSIDEDNFSNLTYLTNTSNAVPMFVSATDFALQTGSPAIDTGDNSQIPAGITKDLVGASRIHNGTVDMGPYENVSQAPTMVALNFNIVGNGSVTPVNGTVYSIGAIATLTATADSGWVFDGWSGDLTSSNNTENLTMDTNKTVTATFSPCIVSFSDTNLKNALLANASINTNNDSEIQCAEAAAFTGTMYVVNQNIASLDGIESFTNITKLFARNNQLTAVNLTSNTSLTQIDISDNMLTSLTLSSSMVSLSRLDVANNLLTALDVSSLGALTELEMSSTPIASINLSMNANLQFIEALGSNLTSLDLSQNNNMAVIYFGGANVTSLDLRNGNLPNMYVETDSAPNLTCIFVDDKTDAVINNWLLHTNNTIVETAIECAILSVEDFEINNKFAIYPNPTSNVLNIKINGKLKQATIYSVLGQQVLKTNNTEINTSSLTNGIYLIKIEDQNGQTISKRFVKQ